MHVELTERLQKKMDEHVAEHEVPPQEVINQALDGYFNLFEGRLPDNVQIRIDLENNSHITVTGLDGINVVDWGSD